MDFRETTIEDWHNLEHFYHRIYRTNHPLQNKLFWEWQYGDEKHGRAFICLDDGQNIVGHLGANFGGNIAWMINGYLDEKYRGNGIMSNLYDLAREYYPMAATAANNLGLGMYKSMRWYRYYDLVRYVKINPQIKSNTIQEVCKKIAVEVNHLLYHETHYFQQPGIKGIKLDDGSTAVSQELVGGLRIVDLENVTALEEQAWDLGYHWIDYITSWNDLKIKSLEKNNWVLDHKSIVPWRLDPIIPGYFCDITFLSEMPLDRNFVVHRSYSDHGRVGSLLF
jgi:hypothetical protein